MLTSRKPSSAKESEFSRQSAFFNKSWLEKEEIESVGLMGLNLNLFTCAEKLGGDDEDSAVSTTDALANGVNIIFRPAAGGKSAMSKMLGLEHWLLPWEEDTDNGGSRFGISEVFSVCIEKEKRRFFDMGSNTEQGCNQRYYYFFAGTKVESGLASCTVQFNVISSTLTQLHTALHRICPVYVHNKVGY
jgi:hypothetical protein